MKKRIAWNKGLKASKDTREKLRISHLGIKQTEESKRKKSEAISGKKHTPEAIQRMRIAQSNRSPEWKARIAEGKLGEKNPHFGKRGVQSANWKGGKTPANTLVRNSREYALWRTAVFTRDNFMCIWGGKEHGNRLHADHIKPFALFPELRFAIDNGRTLCIPCHRTTETYGGRVHKRGNTGGN